MKAIVILIVAATVSGAEPEPPRSQAVKDARREYDTRAKWVQEQYDAAVKKAAAVRDSDMKKIEADYKARLKLALDAALKAKDLEEANRIDGMVKEALLNSDGITGEWAVAYNNGAERRYTFLRDRGVRLVTDTQTLTCTQKADGECVVVRTSDGKAERWTPAGVRMMVEHWIDENDMQRSKCDVVGIATRR